MAGGLVGEAVVRNINETQGGVEFEALKRRRMKRRRRKKKKKKMKRR